MLWLDDLKTIVGVWLMFVLLFWALPKALFPEVAGRNAWMRTYGRFVRVLLLTTLAVVGLSGLHILNAATLAAFYTLMFLALRVRRKGVSKQVLQDWFLGKVDRLEEWHARKGWKDPFRMQKRFLLLQRNNHMIAVLGAATVVFLLTTEVRVWWPLHELRFAYPDAYTHLLRVRELLNDTETFSQPLVLPSLLAAVASLGAVDAMQVTRFVPPLLDILLAIGGGVAIASVFRSNWAGVFTTFILGCYTQKSMVSEGVIGAFFLLLGMAFLADYFHYSHRTSLFDAVCTFILMVLSLPRHFSREIALALALGAVLGLFIRILYRWLPTYHLGTALSLGLMAGIFIAIPPTFPHPFFLEYETTARQSLRLAATFPKERWAIVAPVEQFPETFGKAQYEDLSQFVDKYRDRVGDPAFSFPYQNLLVFVEKNPFKYFPSEPTTVSFSVLTDATYRNYRSPAGRSSLEQAALRLCEVYFDEHSNSRVFYEDENLRVYQFSR